MSERLNFPPELELWSDDEVRLASLFVLRERVARAVAHGVLCNPGTGKPKVENVKSYVCNLRKKFAKLDLKIDTVWGFGWKMPSADQAKLRSLIRHAAKEGSG